MNTNDPHFELIRRCRDGEASPEELAQLESRLHEDAGFRLAYVRYMNLDVALGSLSKASEQTGLAPAIAFPRRHSWPQWRPLTAAAAGIVFGLFGASVVYGMVARHPFRAQTLLVEGFENAAMPIESGVPARKNVWAGELLTPQGAKGQVAPAEGKLMGVLPPHERRKLSYAFRFLDVDSLPAAIAGQTRQIEVTARFHGERPGVRDRFQICLAAFSEDVTEAREIWNKAAVDEQALLHVTRTVKTEPDAFGWVTVHSVIDVPEGTKSLLVSLAAGVVHGDKTKTEHYLDDVQVRLITSDAVLP